MKIKTQARLLIAGTVIVPLLVILANVVHRNFVIGEDATGLPTHEDVSLLLDERVSVEDWETITRLMARSQIFGEITVFRNDYLVLHSTLDEFVPGTFTAREHIFSLLEETIHPTAYILLSRHVGETLVYFLIKTTPSMFGTGLPAFFAPLLLIFIFIILMAIFAICMSIIITRTITNSVEVLENATRRIAEGELDFNVDVKGSNEITSLTNSINKMRNTLKEDELRRSRFIMGITHDLKTPLALIKGYAEAIEDGLADDPASRSNASEIIITKADQLDGMINDLIDFVRMETGEWRAQLESINLTTFLRNLSNTFNKDVELLQHTLTHDIDLPENIFAPIDEKLALRAFENLIHNAVRHTPPGSIIRLTAARKENVIELTISDNGPGIHKEDLPHIFEIFYRGSFSRREQGIGLGLAVVKWVVDYHGWSIAVSAVKGEGTCFTITIPQAKVI